MDIRGGFRYRPFQDFFHFRGVWFNATLRDMMAQKVYFTLEKFTFVGIAIQSGLSERGHYQLDVFCMLSYGVGTDNDVI
jgi:hypothetical protein